MILTSRSMIEMASCVACSMEGWEVDIGVVSTAVEERDAFGW